jgi:hypothetical protein
MSGRYVEGIASIGDRLVLLLNLDRVLNFGDPVPAPTIIGNE